MIDVGIIGATGYTGSELLRLLLGHPGVRVCYATSRTWAGKTVAAALPHLTGTPELVLEEFEADRALKEAAFFFVCLPHGESMGAVGLLRDGGSKVVDLSADFRLLDPQAYRQWYGEHTREDLLGEAVYGLPELYRDRIAAADLVANPGCYPTSVILALAPFLEEGMVHTESIIADSKSGVSGAGREPRQSLHFPEVWGNFSAYNVGGRHRHTGEMEQELGHLAGVPIRITFTPHLLPVNRGILSTIYVKPLPERTEEDFRKAYRDRYGKEPFVRVTSPERELPSLGDVRGSNFCFLGLKMDNRTKTLVLVSAIDNLVKGAAGQALQNMNLMTGLPESTGLTHTSVHP